MSDFTLSGVRLLWSDGGIRPGRIDIVDGRIVAITPEAGLGLDAGRCLVLPGIVDLHGDAFERQLMPRPGVHFAPVPALVETDRQIVANGITTAFHGVTLSWEPGLRGIEAARAFLIALAAARPLLGADTRLHLRFETLNLDVVDEVLNWLASGRIDLLAFNDHIGEIGRDIDAGKLGPYLVRTRLSQTDFLDLFRRVRERASAAPATIETLAGAAQLTGVPVASHDDDSPAIRRQYRAQGSRICEFPIDLATARMAIEGGDSVVLGGPNVVRGGSHAARLSAIEAAEAGFCTALTSDYYYPSLLQAAYVLAARRVLSFDQCWALVSRNPAHMAGLTDRGEIAVGKRADLILVNDDDPALPRVVTSFVGGELRFASQMPG
jgi:alpha-D-ribose 1-methylphosphonate 5-triphosphate diphosphatase